MRRRILDRYGTSPLHLVLVLCSFALTGYAGVRLFQGDTLAVAVWFVGAAVVHDLVLFPLYSLVDFGALVVCGRQTGAADRRPGRARVNYVRVPAFLSAVLLLTWFPLVLGRVDSFESATALSADVFWGRWLLITAGLFAASGGCLTVQLWRARPPKPSGGARTPKAHGRNGAVAPPHGEGPSKPHDQEL